MLGAVALGGRLAVGVLGGDYERGAPGQAGQGAERLIDRSFFAGAKVRPGGPYHNKKAFASAKAFLL